MRILVVDDQEATADVLARGAAADGHEVRSAATLAAAREIVDAGWPDIIVLDLRLDDAGPRATVTQAIAWSRECRLPLLVVSGWLDRPDAVRLRGAGIDWVTKPSGMDVLLRHLDEIGHTPQAVADRLARIREKIGELASELDEHRGRQQLAVG